MPKPKPITVGARQPAMLPKGALAKLCAKHKLDGALIVAVRGNNIQVLSSSLPGTKAKALIVRVGPAVSELVAVALRLWIKEVEAIEEAIEAVRVRVSTTPSVM